MTELLEPEFTFIDLFAGIGGFHRALEGLGGQCVFASEIDPRAQAVYNANFPSFDSLHGDIIPLTEPEVSSVIPDHDLLAAGFPCQPFSKSGKQAGIEDARGTLFFNIHAILKARRPKYILLENVKNLVGPKHRETWALIRSSLRELGYWVPQNPGVFSPHFLPPGLGGAPQNRERVFIVGKYVGERKAQDSEFDLYALTPKPVVGWDIAQWNLFDNLIESNTDSGRYSLGKSKAQALDIWADFLERVGVKGSTNRSLPGFPLWEFAFVESPATSEDLPGWKVRFLEQNSEFYKANQKPIDEWREANPAIRELPASFRKFEWQAGSHDDLTLTAVQFRPSGLRVKPATYLPTLVALNQTSYLPKIGRTISVEEALKLQSFPNTHTFGEQPDAISFKQLGNSVSVSTVSYVFQEYLKHFARLGI